MTSQERLGRLLFTGTEISNIYVQKRGAFSERRSAVWFAKLESCVSRDDERELPRKPGSGSPKMVTERKAHQRCRVRVLCYETNGLQCDNS